MVQDIANADARGDLVVVSFHWGDEYQQQHNVQQERIAMAAIDAGADLIIGHHPHVIQEVKQYRDGWIAYSLGNFIFDQTFSEETMRGLALRVTLEGTRIDRVESLGVSISRQYQPSLNP
jgi:poly-gamma-glutamate synthesis protein (capsule biosynthesis protein)